jgi:hypothetical protein
MTNHIADRADNRLAYMQVEPFPKLPLLPWRYKAYQCRVAAWKERADAWTPPG